MAFDTVVTFSGNLLSGQVGPRHLSANSVWSGHVGSGSVGGGLGTRSIASGTVGPLDLGSGSVLSGALSSGVIGRFHVGSGQFAGFELGSGSIVSGRIASGQVGFGHLANASVASGTLASGSISRFAVASGSFLGFELGSGAIVSGRIASGQIGDKHLADNSVGSGHVQSGRLFAYHLQSGTIFAGAGIGVTVAESGITVANLSGAAGGGGSPTLGYVYGFQLTWVSSGQVNVGSGICRDSTDAVFLTMAARQSIVVSGSNGGINGVDISPIGNTHMLTSGLIVSGPTLFNHWPIRRGVGLVALSGTAGIVGSGGDVLNQISPGDLVGTSGQGMWRVTAVNSGMFTTALSGGLVSGSLLDVIENAFFMTSGQLSRFVDNILSGVSMQISNVPLAASGNAVPGFIGGAPGGSGVVQQHMMVWAGNGLSGTNVFLSNQRTRPMFSGVVGSIESGYRRIGSVIYNKASGRLVVFNQIGNGPARSMVFSEDFDNNILTILTGGNATSWTTVTANKNAPPTANSLLCTNGLTRPGQAGVTDFYIRPRNQGSTETNRRNYYMACEMSGAVIDTAALACDPSQALDYVLDNGTANPASIFIAGYFEDLK